MVPKVTNFFGEADHVMQIIVMIQMYWQINDLITFVIFLITH